MTNQRIDQNELNDIAVHYSNFFSLIKILWLLQKMRNIHLTQMKFVQYVRIIGT